MALRKFDDWDWEAFSGCESKEPMIAEDLTVMLGEHPCEATIVLDGRVLALFVDIREETNVYQRTFFTEHIARCWADVLAMTLSPGGLRLSIHEIARMAELKEIH